MIPFKYQVPYELAYYKQSEDKLLSASDIMSKDTAKSKNI